MIIVDLNNIKKLEFSVTNSNLIKSAELVIPLPLQIELRFFGKIREDLDEIHVHIPILSDKIKEKTLVEYYLEVEDINKKFHKLFQGEMLFQFSPVISQNFHDQNISLNAKLNERNELTLDTKVLTNKNIEYKTAIKPPRRTEILVIGDFPTPTPYY